MMYAANTLTLNNKVTQFRQQFNIQFLPLIGLRGQPLRVPGEHGGLPDVVQTKVQHTDSLLKRNKF